MIRVVAVLLLICWGTLSQAEHLGAFCCPFCSAPTLTLTEQLNSAQTAALVQWKSGKPANLDEGFNGTTEYEIVQVVHDSTGKLAKGQSIHLDRHRAGKVGDLFVLLGTVTESIEWSSPLEVTETSFNYMVQAPTKESPATARLAYFLRFLEYSDPIIANDAYAEFANAPYEDIVPLAKDFPREKLRTWLADPQLNPTRIGLYGLMLGLCGQPDDAKFVEELILKPTADFRLGIDGVMAGYLLLRGGAGLDVIKVSKLQNSEVPFSETFAAMQALRFMWTYGADRIPKQDLRNAMQILLDRPNLADLVIVDLARWHDWGVMDRLFAMYTSPEYDVPSIKRAIVRFLMIAEKSSVEKGDISETQLKHAQDYLARLRETDPATVSKAEKYFFD